MTSRTVVAVVLSPAFAPLIYIAISIIIHDPNIPRYDMFILVFWSIIISYFSMAAIGIPIIYLLNRKNLLIARYILPNSALAGGISMILVGAIFNVLINSPVRLEGLLITAGFGIFWGAVTGLAFCLLARTSI
jgi:hypothetical protein